MFDLDRRVSEWEDRLRERGTLTNEDIVELESHLREEIETLARVGLSEEEAFIIGAKRIGESDRLSTEFAKVNGSPLWKQLAFHDTEANRGSRIFRDVLFVGILCALAGTVAKLPELFGIPLLEGSPTDQHVYVKNASLFVLPFIAVFFLVRRATTKAIIAAVLGIFLVSIFVVNLFPAVDPYHTLLLTGLHLPLFLWLVVGLAYAGPGWRDTRMRMDFLRCSGEAFIYGVLVLCGVFVLMFFTLQIFSEIELNITTNQACIQHH